MKELEQQQHQQEIESTRVGGFGGSDAALFLRIAKKGGVEGLSNTDLYRIAVAMGIKPYAPVPVTEAMNNGHIFEDSYERMLKDSGITTYEREVRLVAECQPKNFKIFAHADFLINGKTAVKKIVIVHECKFIADEEKSADDVAETYKAQLQWYYMLGVEYVDLIRGYGNPEYPSTQDLIIDKDEDIIDTLKLGIQILDDAIESGWAPEIEEELVDEMSNKMQNIIHDYEKLIGEKSVIDKKIDEMKAQIAEYMTLSNVAKINTPLGVFRRTSDTIVKSFDAKKFEKENAELYKQYIKESTRKGFVTYTLKKKLIK